ncbi:LCP family protein [Candidatus Saccharibacteria bacterium]|nr:LCP family protein [Candidatus Saccharibacteria bacterium]
MAEKNKTIDGMAVRRTLVRRRSSGIDGLKPATGTKTTVSREVRMRQAEKVLREREARERAVREARLRTARIKAAQMKTADDTSIRPAPKVTRNNVYSDSTSMAARRAAAARLAIRTRANTPRPITRPVTSATTTSDNVRRKTSTPTVIMPEESPRRVPTQQTERPAVVSGTRTARTATISEKEAEKINREEGRLARVDSIDEFLGPVNAFDDIDEKPRKKIVRKNPRKMEEELELEKPKKKKKGFFKWFRRLFVLLILGGIGFGLAWSNGLIAKLTGGQSGIFDAIGAVFNPDVELKKGENGRTNVLVFGTSGYEMEGSGHDGAQLTDSIMLVSFDKESDDVAMVNLPRDLYVGGTCTSTGKVNEVYWCANTDDKNEAGGAKALQDTVAKILGVETQYYVHINWGALVQIVDALGGVTVTLDENINDSWTKTYIKAGEPTKLNGEQALGLARARHGTEQGDFSRGASQQKLLIALQQRILEEKVDVGQALALVNAVGDNLRTNFTLEEIKSMVHLASDVNISNMRQVALTNPETNTYYVTNTTMPVGGYDISFVVPSAGTTNYTQIKKFIAKEFSTDLATREGANLLVLNGTGVSGTASKERDSLEANGFTVGAIDDAPDGEYPAKYYIYDVTAKCPGTLASLQKKYDVEASTIETLPEGIQAQGFDFVIIVGSQGE